MENNCCTRFQDTVDNYLIRHRSVLDVLTKYQEATARVNRAVAKAVTECGCIKVTAAQQHVPDNIDYHELKNYMSSHISGEPCENCKEIISTELGQSLFYLTALCNLTGLKLNDIIEQECDHVNTLGVFHLS